MQRAKDRNAKYVEVIINIMKSKTKTREFSHFDGG